MGWFDIANCDVKERPRRPPHSALRFHRTRRHHGRERPEQSARCADEYDVRGRRWMDCIGRTVVRPSDRESASQRVRRSQRFGLLV